MENHLLMKNFCTKPVLLYFANYKLKPKMCYQPFFNELIRLSFQTGSGLERGGWSTGTETCTLEPGMEPMAKDSSRTQMDPVMRYAPSSFDWMPLLLNFSVV
jgi:hypothetical protein